MKTLYLVRHAKSSWSYDGLGDFDRPLGKRGRRDVVRMGAFVKSNIPAPNLMLSSAASRAFYTALFMADAWDYPEDAIVISDSLYHADAYGLQTFVRKVGDADVVALFGHNPGLTSFYNNLCSDYIDNLPTCALVGLQLEIPSWKALGEGDAKRLFYQIPKKL